jgi:wyosine [tRNA(Phe)-imidazoG37] synthetase (radical SAM superfamily)
MRKYQHLYGPVPSRRLGRSLGVDLVPHKICTYDCIYCQIGETTRRTLLRGNYLSREEVLEEIRLFLSEEEALVDYFSVTGSGEPTLHSEIGKVIEEIKKTSSIPVAVITNGSLIYDPEVRKDLLAADVVLPSMDAVSPEIFNKINRPVPGFPVQKMMDGLVEFREIFNGQIWLEILFCKGVNDTREELHRMKKAVGLIRPDLIHLNTVVRPPSEAWALPLGQKEMEEIRDFFGEKASIISEFNRHIPPARERDVKEEILRILKRRPLSLLDLSEGMGISQHEIEQDIGLLLNEGRIKSRIFGDTVYYESSDQ